MTRQLIMMLAIVALTASCTLIEATDQCQTTTDCVQRGGEFAESICRAHACVALTSPDCPTVIGGPIQDDTVLLGHLTSLLGPNKSIGDASQAALRLALSELASFNRGVAIDASVARHPVAAVVCADDSPDGVSAVRGARHLVAELGVQVIIGPVLSDTANNVARQVTIPLGALMINPFSVSPTLTPLASSGLFFRTSTSNAPEPLGMALHVAQIERLLPTGEPTRIALIVRGDQYGQGLAQGIFQNLKINGGTAQDALNIKNVLRRDFPRRDLDPTFMNEVQYRQEIVKFMPHIILVLGTGEMPERIAWIEANWPVGRPRPYYLGSEGLKGDYTRALVQADQAHGLQQRLRVMAPSVNWLYYQEFANRWQGSNAGQTPPGVYGTTTTYDAVYLVAYALATLRGQPLTGASVAAGLWRTAPESPILKGRLVPAGPNALTEGIIDMSAGKPIDYDGVSGPLDFDVAHALGEAPDDYDILCLSGSPLVFTQVQVYRVAKAGAMADVGAYVPCP